MEAPHLLPRSVMIDVQLRVAVQEAIWSGEITQAELARRTGLSPATISRFLKGERAPSFEAIDKLLDALQLECVIRPRRKRKDD